MRSVYPLSLTLLVLSQVALVHAEVGDPTLRTDHPQYAGEGAFQTAADCVEFATRGRSKPQDRALGIYNWLLTHQFHLMSPQEWCVPGMTPDTRTSQEDLVVWDAARSRFSYGYGLCGTVHAWNEAYWRAAGMPARRRGFPGHTNSEIFYDGSWHAFDTDMAGLLFRPDGVVAGYEDLRSDKSLAEAIQPPIPHYPFAWPGDFEVMKAGWREVASQPNWLRLYNGGYEAHPGIVHLRSGETFTRWFDPDHFGGREKRRFWHHQQHGPFRDWTFVNTGEPRHDRAKSNARGNASYCNGEFVYQPDLTSDRFRQGLVDHSANIAARQQSPSLHSPDQQAAWVTFRHFSPYVICGDPVDDANPMSSRATDGFVIEGRVVGDVQVEVSADQGQTWSNVPNTTFPLDLTEFVKGRYGWQVRFRWTGAAGVDQLRFTTTTQVNQTIYPRLKSGGSEVTYRSTSRAVVAVLPNFGLPEAQAGVFEEVSRRSDNVAYQPRGPQSRHPYMTTNNRPGSVVFPIVAPASLREVRAAVRYQVRVPPPPEYDYRLDVSVDEGRSWQTFAQADIPSDNEHSSGWLAGATDVSGARASRALVRVTFYAGGHRTGLIDVQLYGIHDTGPAAPLSITYGWLDGDVPRTHEKRLTAETSQQTWHIATGNSIRDQFVRIAETAP